MRKTTTVAFCCVVFTLVHGCGASKDAVTQSEPTPTTALSTSIEASEGFSWVVPGELAAMPLPGRYRPLDQDAAFLEQEGIDVLVSLTEDPPDADVLSSRSIQQEHIPVTDFTPPTLDQMIEFSSLVETSTAEGKAVGVHCTAGLGRSGTMAAAFLVGRGSSADDAIRTIRQLRPGSVETPDQEAAVRDFEEYLRTVR